MRPVRRFEVTPAIPPALAALPELARNLHWSWDAEAIRLFARLWPGWQPGDAHPAEMVRTTSAERLAELAADSGIVNDLGAVSRRLQTALKGTTWFGTREASSLRSVAYFSPEFGISEALPQYSGGLGVLAGDHLKASSDLGVPLVGVGLLYTEGYFRQRLDANGWQQESVADFTPHSLGLVDTGVELTVDLAGDTRQGARLARRHRSHPAVPPRHRRRRQLGPTASPSPIASTAATSTTACARRSSSASVACAPLRALGLAPDVFHTNEGHAGFLGLERVRELVGQGLPFDAAVEVVRGGGVFTTHTPVPAGIDRFPRALLEPYFTAFAAECGVTFDELFAIGVHDDEPLPSGEEPKFNMAVMGLRLAARSNGVARLHGAVSRQMFRGLWPDLAVDEVPIGAVTNGVHGRTWVSPRVDALLSRVVGRGLAGGRRLALGPRPWHRPAGSVGDDQQRPRRPRASRPPTPRSGRPRSDRADGRLRPPLRHLQAGDAAALRRRSPLRPAVRQRASRAVRLRRQGPPGGHARQGTDPAHRAVRSRRRTFDTGSCSSPTTTSRSPGRCTAAATCG